MFDRKGDRGSPVWGILYRNEGSVLRVFWGSGHKTDVFRWQLEEGLIKIVDP